MTKNNDNMKNRSMERREFLKIVGGGALAISLAGCSLLKSSMGGGREPFSIIALPDTQYLSKDFPQIFDAQTRWIAENRDALNILCMIHEHDSQNEFTVLL